MIAQRFRATFAQTVTDEQLAAWPPRGVYPTGLVDAVADALMHRECVLIAGESQSGKSTLQFAALQKAAERTKVAYVDTQPWTVLAQDNLGKLTVIKAVDAARHYDVLSLPELRLCDHARRLQNGEPAACDEDLGRELVTAASLGAGVSTTLPVAGALEAILSMSARATLSWR